MDGTSARRVPRRARAGSPLSAGASIVQRFGMVALAPRADSAGGSQGASRDTRASANDGDFAKRFTLVKHFLLLRHSPLPKDSRR